MIYQEPLTDLLLTIIDNRGRSAPTEEAGVPLIATNCIKSDSIYPVFEKIRFVSQETYENWFRGHPIPGDIIIVNKGTPGLVALVPDPVDFVIAQDMVALRPDPAKVDPLYLFAFMRSDGFKSQVESLHVGTLIPHLKKSHFNLLKIDILERNRQVEVGRQYFDLSRKIELNRRMNEALEAMARAIFRSWFVDFDPVRIKARGGDPTAELGLYPEIAALFPDSFQDSELGDIPSGWDCVEVGSLARVERGLSYKGSGLTDEGLPMINLGCFKGNGIFSSRALKNYSGEFKERNLVSQGDLVYANTDITQDRVVIGSPALVPDVDGQPLLFSHHVSCLRFLDNLAPLKTYVYYTMLQTSFRERASGFATGTTVLALPKDAVERLLIALPPFELLNHLEEVVSGLRLVQAVNDRESAQLSEVRDYLLPRLLSGVIRPKVEDVP